MYYSAFRCSKWFTRGWTLQELLAPHYVDFFDKSWNWIGTKNILVDLLRAKTGISDFARYKMASVAQKMSWASRRETTRIEDMAYCLLGLFGVHIPPPYGEGENAFIRLQLEIMNKTDDDSILAWSGPFDLGLLAQSPSDFTDSSSFVRAVWDPQRPPHSMTNKGLCVHFPLIPSGSDFIAPLNCTPKDPDGSVDDKKVIALCIHQQDGGREWFRWKDLQLFDVTSPRLPRNVKDYDRTTLYVPQVSASDRYLS